MIDIIILDARQCILGAEIEIGLDPIRLLTGVAFTPTATVEIFDTTGSSVLSSTAMTVAGGGTLYCKASYQMTTGAGKLITAAGDYRAEYTVTVGTQKQVWQQLITVKAKPF